MALTRQVICALNAGGTELMGSAIPAFHYPDRKRVSGRLLTLEAHRVGVLANHRARVFSSPEESA